ncbi:MAG: pantetheine-phosphate adenylyltransferase [Gemmatimonadetes bacterium]|nr:pantetheine-phosphate adenylyltransferase [Gemmatimonadota bacterium]
MPTKETVAIFPGSFDPITKGHEEIARRTLGMADRVVVAVARTATKPKRQLFDVEERVELVNEVFADDERIVGGTFSGLLVDFALERRARFVVRGLRAISDFEYEMQMAQMNRGLSPEIETVFLVPDVSHSFLSSSLVREVAALGGDVSPFLAPVVLERVRSRLGLGGS